MHLTTEQELLGRRNFMKAAATIPAVGAFTYATWDSGPVKTAIVGTGMEGRVLIEAINPKYIFLKGICDIRPDNRGIAKWTVEQKLGINEDVTVYPTYEDLLADDEVEAVLIATPLKWHGPMMIEALKAGKHVMCEKTMAMHVSECQEAIQIARQNNLILQIGHMKFYNPNYWDMYKMYSEGLLGNVYHIRTAWHRNTDWNYWKYVEKKYHEEVRNFDPTKWEYENIEELVNWRWYNNTSRGMWTELCSHQIAISNWLFSENGQDTAPKGVYAYGSHMKKPDELMEHYKNTTLSAQERDQGETLDEKIARIKGYDGDPRTINDHVYAIFDYNDGRAVTFSSIQSNAFDDAYEMIMGTYATIILKNETQSYLFWEVGWDENSAREAAENKKATSVAVTQEGSDGSAVAAHSTLAKPKGGGGDTGINPLDPYKWELEGFAHSIRQGAPNLCDGVRGMLTTMACNAAQESENTMKRVEIEPVSV